MLTPMANRFRLIDPTTGKETTDLVRLAELNPNQYASDAMWSLHSDNSKSISDNPDYYLEMFIPAFEYHYAGLHIA